MILENVLNECDVLLTGATESIESRKDYRLALSKMKEAQRDINIIIKEFDKD